MRQYPDRAWAADANFTIRLTYGQVLPYDPADGVTYHYYTTLRGVMEKEDPKNPTRSKNSMPRRISAPMPTGGANCRSLFWRISTLRAATPVRRS